MIRLYRAWWRFTDALADGARLHYWIAGCVVAMFGLPVILRGVS